MRGKYFFITVVIYASFSLAAEALTKTSLIIEVEGRRLTINGSQVNLSDIHETTIDYLRAHPQTAVSHTPSLLQTSDNMPQVIIQINTLQDPIYLFQIIEQLERTYHQYKNQMAIRYFQKYYAVLEATEQNKIDTICQFQIKKCNNNELVTIIPQLNH